MSLFNEFISSLSKNGDARVYFNWDEKRRLGLVYDFVIDVNGELHTEKRITIFDKPLYSNGNYHDDAIEKEDVVVQPVAKEEVYSLLADILAESLNGHAFVRSDGSLDSKPTEKAINEIYNMVQPMFNFNYLELIQCNLYPGALYKRLSYETGSMCQKYADAMKNGFTPEVLPAELAISNLEEMEDNLRNRCEEVHRTLDEEVYSGDLEGINVRFEQWKAVHCVTEGSQQR